MRKVLLALSVATVTALGTTGCGDEATGAGSAAGVGAGAGSGTTTTTGPVGVDPPGGSGGLSACELFTEEEAVKLLGGPVKKQAETPVAGGDDTHSTQCGFERADKLFTAAALYIYRPKNTSGAEFTRRMVEGFHTVATDVQDVPGYGQKAVYSPGTQTVLIFDDGVAYQLILFDKNVGLTEFKAFADMVK